MSRKNPIKIQSLKKEFRDSAHSTYSEAYRNMFHRVRVRLPFHHILYMMLVTSLLSCMFSVFMDLYGTEC